MQNKQKGFTIIELLVVIVIIGILATISTATFGGNIEKAKKIKLLAEWTQDQKKQEANCIKTKQDDCSREIVLNGTTWSRYNTNVGIQKNASDSLVLGGYGAEKLCLDNDVSMCETHGALYTYEAATGVCPDGWKLPSFSDFSSIITNNTTDIFTDESVTGLNLSDGLGYCAFETPWLCSSSSLTPNGVIYWTDADPVELFGPGGPKSVLVVNKEAGNEVGILSNNYIPTDGIAGLVRCVKE